MRRRDFITGIAGSAAVWPLAARAQQGERVRRIGVIMGVAEGDSTAQPYAIALKQGLHELGWTEGRNVHVDYRWGGGDAERTRTHAVELAGLAPDIILATNTPALAALRQQTRTIPLLFLNVTDPVGRGFVTSLARPGGNITGFTSFEFSISGKWLEILKDAAPRVTRVGVIFNPKTAPHAEPLWRMAETLAPSFALHAIALRVHDLAELESAIDAQGREPGGGLIVMPDIFTAAHRKRIIALSAAQRLPAIFGYGFLVRDGGLIGYGPDILDMYRRSASYIDRILKGEKPADLPVQAPTKFEMVVNLKTARALGLSMPPALLARADEVIE